MSELMQAVERAVKQQGVKPSVAPIMVPKVRPESKPVITELTESELDETLLSSSYQDREYTWADMRKAYTADVANNSIATTGVAITGALAATHFGAPLAVAAAVATGAAYAHSLFGTILTNRNNTEFWTNYQSDLNELNKDTTEAGFKRGMGEEYTFGNLSSDVVMRENTSEMLGGIAGLLVRDTSAGIMLGAGLGTVAKAKSIKSAATKAGKSADKIFSYHVANNVSTVGSMAITNSITKYNREVSNGVTSPQAFKSAIAHGLGVAGSSAIFMGIMPWATANYFKKVWDAPIGGAFKTGAEFAGWGAGQEISEALLLSAMTGKEIDVKMKPADAATLFGMAFAGRYLGGKGMGLLNSMSKRTTKKLKQRHEMKIQREVAGDIAPVQSTGMDIDSATIAKNVRKATPFSSTNKATKPEPYYFNSNEFNKFVNLVKERVASGEDKVSAITKIFTDLNETDRILNKRNVESLLGAL